MNILQALSPAKTAYRRTQNVFQLMPLLDAQKLPPLFSLRSSMGRMQRVLRISAVAVLCVGNVMPAAALPGALGKNGKSSKDKAEVGGGLTTELAASQEDVLQALQEVLDDLEIRGTYQYEKEKLLTGASRADSAPAFGPWKGAGNAYFKIAPDVIAPRHFKGSADIGAVSVRYVIEAISASKTRVRIDAVFVEAAHREVHPSEGSVESGELGAIQEHLDAITNKRKQAEDEKKRDAQEEAERDAERERQAASARSSAASPGDLEQRVHGLRQQVESTVKAGGAPLRGAPFQASPALQTVAAGTEVVILIVTPYWYGIETPDGHRGWMQRSSLDAIP